MHYTFQTQYPAPFDKEWKTSIRRFPRLEDCVEAAALWLEACVTNETYVAVRIKVVEDCKE